MKNRRMFLYEIGEDLLNSENPTEFKKKLYEYLDHNKKFRMFIDIIFNGAYSWECDKEVYNTTSRSERENGGFPTAWYDVIDVIQNKLLKNNDTSKRFIKSYQKVCYCCNYKDVEYLNTALRYRAFKGVKKRYIIDMVKEYFGDEYTTI